MPSAHHLIDDILLKEQFRIENSQSQIIWIIAKSNRTGA